MAIPITGSVNASILPKLNGMPGSTLPGTHLSPAASCAEPALGHTLGPGPSMSRPNIVSNHGVCVCGIFFHWDEF